MLEATEPVVPYDVTLLQNGDIVHYLTTDTGGFTMKSGIVKEDNLFKEGVDLLIDVEGKERKYFVSKWFICIVERNGQTLFDIITEELNNRKER